MCGCSSDFCFRLLWKEGCDVKDMSVWKGNTRWAGGFTEDGKPMAGESWTKYQWNEDSPRVADKSGGGGPAAAVTQDSED